LKIKKRILLFIFCLAILSFASHSQSVNLSEIPDTSAIGPQGDDDNEMESEETETITNEYFKIVRDNNFDVPFSNQYFFWDTINIHPYQSKMNKFTETRTLKLVDSLSLFAMPLKNKINSDFGWRKWKYHYGIDLGLNVGDSVVSTFDGMVRVVKRSKSYGRCIVIRHKNGLETLYAHLSRTLVVPDQEVKAGELIGLGGSTGHSTGPHLHFEMRYLGGALNPNSIIDFKNYALLTDSLVIDHCSFDYLNDVQKARYYSIRKGDSLSRIAHKLGVPMSKLCKLNGISRKSTLRIGRRLRYT
jgi:murein DD-endopeptidase MepM/ murein hydrolase activator NlpD